MQARWRGSARSNGDGRRSEARRLRRFEVGARSPAKTMRRARSKGLDQGAWQVPVRADEEGPLGAVPPSGNSQTSPVEQGMLGVPKTPFAHCSPMPAFLSTHSPVLADDDPLGPEGAVLLGYSHSSPSAHAMLGVPNTPLAHVAPFAARHLPVRADDEPLGPEGAVLLG